MKKTLSFFLLAQSLALAQTPAAAKVPTAEIRKQHTEIVQKQSALHAESKQLSTRNIHLNSFIVAAKQNRKPYTAQEAELTANTRKMTEISKQSKPLDFQRKKLEIEYPSLADKPAKKKPAK